MRREVESGAEADHKRALTVERVAFATFVALALMPFVPDMMEWPNPTIAKWIGYGGASLALLAYILAREARIGREVEND